MDQMWGWERGEIFRFLSKPGRWWWLSRRQLTSENGREVAAPVAWAAGAVWEAGSSGSECHTGLSSWKLSGSREPHQRVVLKSDVKEHVIPKSEDIAKQYWDHCLIFFFSLIIGKNRKIKATIVNKWRCVHTWLGGPKGMSPVPGSGLDVVAFRRFCFAWSQIRWSLVIVNTVQGICFL